jgi:hypothetical protein
MLSAGARYRGQQQEGGTCSATGRCPSELSWNCCAVRCRSLFQYDETMVLEVDGIEDAIRAQQIGRQRDVCSWESHDGQLTADMGAKPPIWPSLNIWPLRPQNRTLVGRS